MSLISSHAYQLLYLLLTYFLYFIDDSTDFEVLLILLITEYHTGSKELGGQPFTYICILDQHISIIPGRADQPTLLTQNNAKTVGIISFITPQFSPDLRKHIGNYCTTRDTILKMHPSYSIITQGCIYMFP